MHIYNYVSNFLVTNILGSIRNSDMFNSFINKYKDYSHYIIKSAYINMINIRNNSISSEDFYSNSNKMNSMNNINNTKKPISIKQAKKIVSYSNTHCKSHCMYKDELNRELLCIIEETNNKFVPKIYLMKKKTLILEYINCSEYSRVHFYKNVLDLSDIKDYLIITCVKSACHVLKLDKETKFFTLFKIINNDKLFITVIPNNDFKENYIILFDHYYSAQDIYELDTNNNDKVRELDCAGDKYYFPYYDFNMDKSINNESIYLIECSEDRVRLLLNKDIDNVVKVFNIIPKEEEQVNNAVIVDREDFKYLYCSSDSYKIYVFDFESEKLLLTMGDICCRILKLSYNMILGYDCNQSNNKFILLDTDFISINDNIEIQEKNFIFEYSNLQVLSSSNELYLSAHLTSKELVIYILD